MSFSASWGSGDADVCGPDANEDLVLEKASLSPPLEGMAADVRAAVEEVARASAGIVAAFDKGAGKSYTVSASGHVRQADSTAPGYVSLSVTEKSPQPEPAPAPAEPTTDEATTGSSAAIADDQLGQL